MLPPISNSDQLLVTKHLRAPQSGPVIIPCEEQGPIEVRLIDVLDRAGKLRLNPDIENGDFFAMSLKKGVISLRARGYVGYIPLTDQIIVHVRPRVPVSNLSRVVRLSGEPPTVLTSVRRYSAGAEWNESLLDVYAAALARYIEQIASRGLLREYVRRDDSSSSLRGRIILNGTLGLRAKGMRHKAHIVWFDRDADNAPNRCIKYATWLLARRYIALNPKVRESRIAHRDLNALYPVFDGVTLDHSRRFLEDPQVTGRQALPSLRSYYRDALNVAIAVIQQRAVLIESGPGPVRMPSIVLNMNYVFEAYIRNILRQYVASRALPLSVLDGNQEGKRGLYNGIESPSATPDIVVHPNAGGAPLVLEVKNVPIRDRYSEREYINQAVTYALAYRATQVVLIHPRASAFQSGGLHYLGNVDHVAVYQYRFDLGAEDLVAEDEQFGDVVARLMTADEAN
jgi:5-methylcytosine-specific restriction enzyme subunit McrC